MSFLWPAGFAFLALLPPVIALYFLKLKRSRKVVSSTYLLKRAVDAYRVNRPFQRFQNHVLLWLQLLILTLLALGLARPFITTAAGAGDVHIYLVDHSASMAARQGAHSRLDLAKAFVRSAVEGKRAGDQAAIIAFSDRGLLVSPLSTDGVALAQALGRIPQTARPTHIEEAWQSALAIARRFDHSHIYLVSDGGFGSLDQLTQANATVHFVPAGSAAPNLGFVRAGSRRSEDDTADHEIYAGVLNSGGQRVEAAVELYLDGKLADAKRIAIAAGAQQGVVFHCRASELAVAELRLPEKDAFADDNRAWLSLRPAEPARVLLVGEDNGFLQDALLCDPDVALERVSKADWDAMPEAGRTHDLVIFNCVSPASLERGNYLFVGSLPPLEGYEDKGDLQDPIIVHWDKDHALTQFINFSTLHVGSFIRGENPRWTRDVVSGDKGGLCSVGERGGLRVAVLRFRVEDSDWPLRVSFPMFLSNAVRWARGEDAAAGFMSRPGEALALRVPAGSGSGRMILPDGSERPLAAGDRSAMQFKDAEQPGVYRMRWAGQARESVYAVNLLDAVESDLRVPDAVTMGDQTLLGARQSALVPWEFTPYLLLLAIAALLAEWIYFQFGRR